MELYENKDISIMCPNCKKFLTKADKRDPRIHKLACNHCRKLILFIPASDYRKIKMIPKRTQASGMRFY